MIIGWSHTFSEDTWGSSLCSLLGVIKTEANHVCHRGAHRVLRVNPCALKGLGFGKEGLDVQQKKNAELGGFTSLFTH